MIKRIIAVLFAVLLVFGLAAGAGYYLAIYQSSHIFIQGDAYPLRSTAIDLRDKTLTIAEFEAIQAQIPQCRITWMVPFQGSHYSSDSAILTVTSVTREDLDLIHKYFKNVTELKATGSRDYKLLTDFQKERPTCQVTYDVDLGGRTVDPDVAELTLLVGEYDYDTLMTNMLYLPALKELTLKTPELTLEQMDALKAAYPSTAVHCTVDILGTEYDTETTELNLAGLKAEDLEAVTEKLNMLPGLNKIELMDADGKCELTKEQVKGLMTAMPNVVFNYTFDFFGETLSTATEEVIMKDVKIGDEKESEIRLALDLLTNCKRFVLDNCSMSSEVMAKIREDYRSRTKVVWRIWFATSGSCLTDVEIFRSVGNLEKNYKSVKYCEDVVYMDIGHCEYLFDIDFVASMPKLKALIASGSPIKTLEPLANCKELELLELSFCGYIEDLTPLKNCTNLKMLNITDTKVEDLSPLDGIKLTNLAARRYEYAQSRVPVEERERFMKQNPGCQAAFDNTHAYYVYWRYEEDNKTFTPYYEILRIVFRYDLEPNDPKQTGMYIADIESYLEKNQNRLKGTKRDTFAAYLDAQQQALAAYDQRTQAAAAAPASTEPTEAAS